MDIRQLQIKYALKQSDIRDRNAPGPHHEKILPWLSVVQATEGSYDIRLGNQKQGSTGEGGFFIAPAHTLQVIDHNVSPKSGRMKMRWIFIDLVINGKYRPDFLYDFPTVIPKEQAGEMNRLFDKLFAASDIFEEYSLYYKIMRLLVSLGTPKTDTLNKSLQNVVAYIATHYDQPLSIETLAELAHLSPSRLHSLFKNSLQITPVAYINNYRITLAAEALVQSEAPISEIAASVGIADPLYFSKLFRRINGLSPREYRNRARKNRQLSP